MAVKNSKLRVYMYIYIYVIDIFLNHAELKWQRAPYLIIYTTINRALMDIKAYTKINLT